MRDGNISATGAETQAPVADMDEAGVVVTDALTTGTGSEPRHDGRTRRLLQRLLRDRATIEHREQVSAQLAKIDEADHARRVANRERRSEARHAAISAALPGMVYFLAILSGVAGQVTSIVAMSGGVTVAIVVAAVLAAAMIEGVGLAFAALAHTARVAGSPAYLLRVVTWGFAFGASAINVVGHYGTVWAYPCGLGSIAALMVWEARSSHQSRDVLAATRQRAKELAAARGLARIAYRKRYGRRVARTMAASLSPEELLEVSRSAVSPQASALDALTGFVDSARKRHGREVPAPAAVDRAETQVPAPAAVDRAETPTPARTGRESGSGATVIPISGATDDEIAAVIAAYPGWREEMPSVRQIGAVFGRGKSVGQRVRKRLVETIGESSREIAS